MNIGIDLDGTVYRSQKLITGCFEAVGLLKEIHEVVFLTNNASVTPLQIIEKLTHLLEVDINIKELVTPLNIAEEYLNDHKGTIYIHGTDLIKKYLTDVGLNISDSLKHSDILLIGKLPTFTKRHIEIYTNFYNKGNKIFAFNKDMTYPTADGFELGTGALVSEVEKNIGVIIESFGKPSEYYLNYLLTRHDKFDYIIGDRIDTDVVLGDKLNSNPILLESGVYQAGDPIPDSIKVKVFSNLYEFSLSL